MTAPPPILPALLVVAVGGGTGAVLRGVLTDTGASVVATLAVNVVGCLALGVLVARMRGRGAAWLFVGPGLLGGFTTMSAWAEQSRALALGGSPTLAALYAALYAVLTPALCVGVALAGMRLAARASGAGPGLRA